MTLVGTQRGSMPVVALPSTRQPPRRDPNWLVHQLPATMAGESFFARFVSIFQDVGGSLVEHADNVDHIVDVSVARPELVRWLGSWVGVSTLDDSQDVALQRRIVVSAARTLTWRGTKDGLKAFLELVTGSEVEVVEGGGVFEADKAPADSAWVRMYVQDLGAEGAGARDLAEFVTVVRDEIPAHVRAELYVGGELKWTSEEESRT